MDRQTPDASVENQGSAETGEKTKIVDDATQNMDPQEVASAIRVQPEPSSNNESSKDKGQEHPQEECTNTRDASAVPLSELLLEKCAVCQKPKAKKRCGRCKGRWYCSTDCQKLDWEHGHNRKCNSRGGLAVGLKVGMKVHARYHGGAKLFAGSIREIREDGTVDILYDDGEWESRIPAMRVQQEGQKQKKVMEKGTEVECRCASWGDQILHGRILQCHQTAVVPPQGASSDAAPPSWAYTYDVKFDHGLVERNVPRKYIFGAFTFPPATPDLPPPPPTGSGPQSGKDEPMVVPAKSALDQASARKARGSTKGLAGGNAQSPGQRRKPSRRGTLTGVAPPEALAREAAAAGRAKEQQQQQKLNKEANQGNRATCPVTGQSAEGSTKLEGVAAGACPYSGQTAQDSSAVNTTKACPFSGQSAEGQDRLEGVEKGCCPYTGKKPGEKTEDGVCPWTGKSAENSQAIPDVEPGKCPYSGMAKPKRGMYDDEDSDDEDVRRSFANLAEKMGDDGTGGCSFAKLAQKDKGKQGCPFSKDQKDDKAYSSEEFHKLVSEGEAEIMEIIGDPSRGADHPDEAKVHHRLCDVYIRQEKGRPAVKHAERALQIIEMALEDQEEEEEEEDANEEGPHEAARLIGPNELVLAYDKVGKAQYSNNDDSQAMKWFQKALDFRRKEFGKDHPSIAASYINIGNVYQYRGDPGRAIEYYEMSLDLRKDKYGENHPDVGISYYSLATGYEYASDFDNAIENYKNALEIWKKTLGEEHELTKKAEKCVDQSLSDKEQCIVC